MPYDNPGPKGGGMADSAMYSDEPDKAEEKPMEEKEEGTEYPPFTVPKEAFGGKDVKPGDQFYFDVKSIHENEVLCQYATDVKEEGEHKEGGEESAPKPEGGGGDSEMSGMMY